MSTCQILHNDLKSNNVVVEKRNDTWNPVIIDFETAHFISDPKPWMSLTASSQESYNCHYPHISLEIVAGSGQQSIQSDVFFFRENCAKHSCVAANSNCKVLRIAKWAILDNPHYIVNVTAERAQMNNK